MINNQDEDIDIGKYDKVFKDLNLSAQEKKLVIKFTELLYKDGVKESDAKVQAFNFAGYQTDGNTASLRTRISRKFAKKEIRAAIASFQEWSLGDHAVETQNAIMKKLHYVLVDFDPSLLITKDGSLKYEELSEIPPETRWMVKSIETTYYGKSADRKQTTVKFHDVMEVMKLATKVLSMQKDILELKAESKVEVASKEGSAPFISISFADPVNENTNM